MSLLLINLLERWNHCILPFISFIRFIPFFLTNLEFYLVHLWLVNSQVVHGESNEKIVKLRLHHSIYWDSKLLAPVVYFADPV